MNHINVLRGPRTTTGAIAGGLLACAAMAAPAYAIPVTTYILESDANLAGLEAAALANLQSGPGADLLAEYGINNGLIFGNVSGSRIDEVAATNAAMLGVQVDALGKLNADGSLSEVYFENASTPGADILAGALTLDCHDAKCASFAWSFDESLTTLAAGWEIVKIGVKYGNLQAFFLVDGNGNGDAEANDGAIEGEFNLFDFAPDAGSYLIADLPAANLLDGMFQINNDRIQGTIVGKTYVLNGLSHIDFFGTPGRTTNLPEPGTLGLLGLGLLGIGAIARRRRSA